MKTRALTGFIVLALALILSILPVAAQQPRAVPSNDSFNTPKAIKVGKNYSVPGVDAATNEINEPVASCNNGGEVIPHSVWFTLSQPSLTRISLSTFGSLLVTPEGPIMNTILAIYEMTGPGVWSQIACDYNTYGTGSSQIVFYAHPGRNYYISAGTYRYYYGSTGSALLPGSTLKLTTRMLQVGIAPPNYGFETPVDGTDWKLRNGSDDLVACSDTTYPSRSGLCAFHFVGTPGVVTKLTQTIAFPSTFLPRKNALLVLGFSFRVMETASLGKTKARFIVSYSDGTLPSILIVDLTGNAERDYYLYRQFIQTLKSSKVKSIKFDLKFASSTGSLLVDNIGYGYVADPATRGADLLPVPPSPAAK